MTDERSPEVSVVIPIYNEERILESAARGLAKALDERGLDFEILLSENGSTDGTRAAMARLEAADPRFRGLFSDTPDYGAALKRGIEAARGRIVHCDEIDLCDPDFYDRALPLLRADQADMVVGSKAAPGARDNRPLYRRSATRVINGMLRVSLGFEGTDTHGLKAFRREALLPVVARCVITRDMFASELVIRATRMGRRVREIPVEVRELRPPSIRLHRRVPAVLGNIARLFWVIRVRSQG